MEAKEHTSTRNDLSLMTKGRADTVHSSDDTIFERSSFALFSLLMYVLSSWEFKLILDGSHLDLDFMLPFFVDESNMDETERYQLILMEESRYEKWAPVKSQNSPEW